MDPTDDERDGGQSLEALARELNLALARLAADTDRRDVQNEELQSFIRLVDKVAAAVPQLPREALLKARERIEEDLEGRLRGVSVEIPRVEYTAVAVMTEPARAGLPPQLDSRASALELLTATLRLAAALARALNAIDARLRELDPGVS
jgi:hypothetical protein